MRSLNVIHTVDDEIVYNTPHRNSLDNHCCVSINTLSAYLAMTLWEMTGMLAACTAMGLFIGSEG